MITQIVPTLQLDVFPIMEDVLEILWDYKKDDISVSGINTPEKLDNLSLYGIRVKYEKNNFLEELLKKLNTKKYNFTVKHQE